MSNWTFIADSPAVWILALVFLVVVVVVSIKLVANQPLFGGRKHRGALEEHYLHGEMTTEQYEDRKSHVANKH